MTSRYALYDIDKLRDRFALASGVPKGVRPHYNISPSQIVPVVLSRDGHSVIERMIWGFIAPGAKDMNSIFRYKTFAARSEGILERPMWRTAVRTQRCLIPANGFFEWKQLPAGKRPFYIHPAHEKLFALAGIYGEWTDPEGVTHGMCTIITINTDAEDDMTPNRLPIIVDLADEADWLNPELSDLSTLFRIMRPYSGKLSIIPVGDAVNSAKADTPELIKKS